MLQRPSIKSIDFLVLLLKLYGFSNRYFSNDFKWCILKNGLLGSSRNSQMPSFVSIPKVQKLKLVSNYFNNSAYIINPIIWWYLPLGGSFRCPLALLLPGRGGNQAQ